MSLDNTKNFAKSSVSTGYDGSATSIVLTAGGGAKMPTVPFNATWWNSTDYADPSDDPNVEIIRVTAISTDTLTATRGQESISATTKNTGGKTYTIIAGLTAKSINTDLPATVGLTRNGHYLTDGSNYYLPTSMYLATTPDNVTFAWRNQGSATETASGKSLILAGAASGNTVRGRETARSSNTILITAHSLAQDEANAFAGLYVRDSVGGKLIIVARKDVSLYVFKYTDESTFSSTPFSQASPILGNEIFFRFRITGGSIFFDVSPDGESFTKLFTEASTAFLANAPDKWGYCINPGSSGEGNSNLLKSFVQS